MEDEVICDAPVWDDVSSFDGRPWRGALDLLTAGYPCQPFSAAGRKLGEQDPRHLWPHVARIIGECAPAAVFLENVAGHVDRGFQQVASELQGLGYTIEAGLFSAAEVGAPHWRIRLFVLAYANSIDDGESSRTESECLGDAVDPGGRPGRWPSLHSGNGEKLERDAPTYDGVGLEAGANAGLPLFAPRPGDYQTWERVLAGRVDLEPSLHRMDDGLANRMDRSRAVGNGVCSLAAALAWRTLRDRINRRLRS
jgi:DNA (cytosine-5)-methyltransferase 1